MDLLSVAELGCCALPAWRFVKAHKKARRLQWTLLGMVLLASIPYVPIAGAVMSLRR